MFTGIIQAMGRVAAMQPNDFGARLRIDAGDWQHGAAPGDSIAVNGCCLTCAPAAGESSGQLSFDVVRETLQQSTLGDLHVGDAVNLEASVTPNTPMGGHFVQGHVDGVGTIGRVQAGADEWRLTVQTDETVMPYVVPKGSIAIDGISLTVAAVDVAARRFEIALIPTTLRMTTLGSTRQGQRVNLETDLIARTVVHWLQHWQGGSPNTRAEDLTLQKLREEGFA